jgi:serine/threonine protein kinase
MSAETVKIHKYEVMHKIGAGGFSSVYKAKHCLTNKIVALKIVKSVEHSKLILNESKIISYLNREIKTSKHFFPTLHWYGTFGKMTCLATTFYHDSFTNVLHNGFADILPKLDLCAQMIEIMHHIHSVGIIHCDVKPDNFMINDEQRLVLIDFGMARMCVNQTAGTHIPNKVSNTFFGTPKYASFHLHLGNRPSRRDDLISVGYLMMLVFDIELPWSSVNSPENSYFVHDAANLQRLELKRPDCLIAHLTSSANADINHYLIPYFKEVNALKYDEKPEYTICNAIFNVLY